MSATATAFEVENIVKNMGMREKPVVLRGTPILPHIKYELVRRPANYWGMDGDMDKSGKEKPGLIELLNRIYLDKFVENTLKNLPVKKAIMIFR